MPSTKEYMKEWRKKNRDRLRSYNAEWTKNNKDKVAIHRSKAAEKSDKNKKREYDKKYREKNRTKLLEEKKKWHSQHKEHAAKKSKEWAISHPLEVNEYRKKYYEKNKSKIKNKSSLYYKNNTEKCSSWRRSNPDKKRAIDQLRRARKIGAPGVCSSFDWKIIINILGNECIHPDKSKCKGAIHQDHVRPLSRGGTNHPVNIVPLCAHHNISKHTDWVDYRTKKQIKQITEAFQLRLF